MSEWREAAGIYFMTERLKSYKLNVYKLSAQAPSLQSLQPSESNPEFEVEAEDYTADLKYKFFVQRNAVHPPSWYGFLRPIIDGSKPPVLSSTSSFVLFVEHNSKIFALTGGYGHTKLPKEFVVDDFGLEMAKRLIDENEIKGLTQKAMKGATRQIHRGLVGYKPGLDLDNYNRFLRAIEGRAMDERFGLNVTGRKSLSFSKKITFNDLPTVFQAISDIEQLPPQFEFPESFELIDEQGRKEILNALLVTEFNRFLNGQGDRERLYLELKDLFMQFECASFNLVYQGQTFDLEYFNPENVRRILTAEGLTSISSLDDLKRIRINGKNDLGHLVLEAEPLLDILIYELDYDRDFYLFSEKKWYKLLDGFKRHIDTQINRITVATDLLPAWDTDAHPTEGQYNDAVAAAKGWAKLDADCVMVQGRSRIEVCDLYDSAQKKFIHVKRAWGTKTSYLFAQGLVSREFNHHSEEFRAKCRDKWPSLFDGQFHKGYSIVFAIADAKAAEADFPKNLSYFAKLNLMQAVSRLEGLGYSVSLTPVNVTAAVQAAR